MTDTDIDTPPAAPEPTGSVEAAADAPREPAVPSEALDPSGRSEESLPRSAPNPASRDPEADPQDGSTEIPPVAPDA